MVSIRFNDNTLFGDDADILVVSEIGLCHNGNIEKAKQMIKESVQAGANAVKFQKRDVDNLAVAKVLDANDKRFPSFGNTYREIRRHIEFSPQQYRELQKCADDCGVLLFASVFDIKSAQQMAALNMPVIKVASHCLTNLPLIHFLANLKIPLLLSTGMATLDEIDLTAKILKDARVSFGLYHCVSEYPHSWQTSNLSFISVLRERYDVPVGYSSHEKENYTSMLAIAAGACSIEKHVTLDDRDEGFDHKMAITMPMLKALVDETEKVKVAMGTGQKQISEKEMETRKKYHCSVVNKIRIEAGQVISLDLLTTKNPGTGIHAKQLNSLVGLCAAVDIEKDSLLNYSMFK